MMTRSRRGFSEMRKKGKRSPRMLEPVEASSEEVAIRSTTPT